jgi:hypothetical protein
MRSSVHSKRAGVYALLHALNYRAWSMAAVRAPVVSILSWFSESVPEHAAIDRLTYINHDGYLVGGHHLVCLAMQRGKADQRIVGDRALPRTVRPRERGSTHPRYVPGGNPSGGS